MFGLSRASRSLTTFAGVLLAALALACSGGANNAPATSEEYSKVSADAGPAVAGRMAAPAEMVAAPVPAAPGSQLPPMRGQDSAAPNMIIRNGNVVIQVDSLELAIDAVRKLAASLGGYVGNVSTSTGEYAVRSATLEMKIPSSRFDEALGGVAPIGKVEQSNTTAEDVGEEFVDVSARVANAKRLEERIVNLLATRAGKLEDVLAVERELARVREEIERYEGRLRFLRSRVSTSTLSVTVHEPAPLVSPNPGTNVIAEAFRNMWRNFVGLVAWVISSLGVVVPVVIVLALAWRFFGRRNRPTT
ncbi:MAG: DUF4349 domain-containing protein [Gemmatimonadetes bacterium]|nr:DUF4349 domain-containing protein [Gemmatimonadota bacterium]